MVHAAEAADRSAGGQLRFGALAGPRVLPGTYTVKMTKGDKVYTARLHVVADPRAKYTLEDRKAQFDLATKLYGLLDHMSWAVDAIVAVAIAPRAAGKLPGTIRCGPADALAASADGFGRRLSPPRKAA